MLVKKLTVPFIKEDILKNAMSCSIASAAISERGFDFIISRLNGSCKCRIITGLDLPTPPKLLWEILGKAGDKLCFKVFTDNFFHPKVYIFELKDKSKVAFIGSGNFTMGGLQENEEVFYKIILPKEIENLKLWFDEYFERSVFLDETIIKEYEKIYPSIKDREEKSRKEKEQFNDRISGEFNWDNVDFKGQYFVREDYLAFDESKAQLNTPEVRKERVKVQNKLLYLHDDLKTKFCHRNNLYEHYDSNHIVSSLDPTFHHEHKLRSMWLAYGRSKAELQKYYEDAKHMDFIRLQVIIEQQSFGIWLMPGKENGGTEDREYFRGQMKSPAYRKKFYDLLMALDKSYWIEVSGDGEDVNTFKSPDALWEFTNSDDSEYYFIIGRNYEPGDNAISEKNVLATIKNEFKKLLPLYNLMKDKSFD